MKSNDSIRGVLLAGVHQWRSSVFETYTAKPLVPVVDRPLINYSLDWLHAGGVRRATVCANSDTAVIRRSLGRGRAGQIEIDYCEDHLPRGSAGCVRDAALKSDSDTFLVADATVIPQQVPIEQLLEAHRRSAAAVTIAVRPSSGSGSRDDLIPIGVRVFDRRALEFIHSQGYQDINETLVPRLHAAGELVVAHPVAAEVPRVTDAESYLSACQWTLEHMFRSGNVPKGFRRRGESLVEESCRVSDGAHLIGPVHVGAGTTIEAGTTIVGPAIIGTQCTIREGTFICHSTVWDQSEIGAHSSLYRCIVVSGARLAPLTIRRDQVLS